VTSTDATLPPPARHWRHGISRTSAARTGLAKETDVGHITVGDENSTPIELYYEDQGAGQPVVLINLGSRISPEAVTGSWDVTVSSVPVAAHAVVSSWIEDFRADVEAVRDRGTPTLVVHGTADDILAIDATARRFRQAPAHGLIPPQSASRRSVPRGRTR
jgi:hypothetical protein